MREQKTYNLHQHDGKYYNFFKSVLPMKEREGWFILDMNINKECQNGWVILQREKKELTTEDDDYYKTKRLEEFVTFIADKYSHTNFGIKALEVLEAIK